MRGKLLVRFEEEVNHRDTEDTERKKRVKFWLRKQGIAKDANSSFMLPPSSFSLCPRCLCG
jgi:hypothetical protein